jgi:hypothetical protein
MNQTQTIKNTVHKATVYTYEVWGNSRDGYDVNDRSCFLRDAYIDDVILDSNYNLLQWLKSIGLIKKGVRLTSVLFDGDEYCVDITVAKNGRPFGCIEISE